jgi:hypothetical protein
MSDEPTILKKEDLEFLPMSLKRETPVIPCTSCGEKHDFYSMVDGIQCQNCYIQRKRRFYSKPVSTAYFKWEPPK